MQIKNQNVFITGANRGFGKLLSEEFLRRGAKVYAGARNSSSIKTEGVIPIQIDVTDPTSIERAISAIPDLTILVNNAGIAKVGSLLTIDSDSIRTEFETNVFGLLTVTRCAAPLLEKNKGYVLNIASAFSWYSMPTLGGYSATKSAVWSLSNGLRTEFAPKGVKVSSFHVGPMETDFTKGYEGVKVDPSQMAKIAVDGIENNQPEIIADDISKEFKKAISGDISKMYKGII